MQKTYKNIREESEIKKFRKFEIRFRERIDPSRGCFYLERWVLTLFGYSLRLHHWIADDDQRFFHDHPWWMFIIILKGGYTDVSPGIVENTFSRDYLSAGNIRFRKATHKHTVQINKGGCWSLLLTGPVSRHWGFWLPNRKTIMRPLRYYQQNGHHQCSVEEKHE